MRSTGKSKASSSASSCCASPGKTSPNSTLHLSIPPQQRRKQTRQLSRCTRLQLTIRWPEATHRRNLRVVGQPQANISANNNSRRFLNFTLLRLKATCNTIIGDRIVTISPLDHHLHRQEGVAPRNLPPTNTTTTATTISSTTSIDSNPFSSASRAPITNTAAVNHSIIQGNSTTPATSTNNTHHRHNMRKSMTHSSRIPSHRPWHLTNLVTFKDIKIMKAIPSPPRNTVVARLPVAVHPSATIATPSPSITVAFIPPLTILHKPLLTATTFHTNSSTSLNHTATKMSMPMGAARSTHHGTNSNLLTMAPMALKSQVVAGIAMGLAPDVEAEITEAEAGTAAAGKVVETIITMVTEEAWCSTTTPAIPNSNISIPITTVGQGSSSSSTTPETAAWVPSLPLAIATAAAIITSNSRLITPTIQAQAAATRGSSFATVTHRRARPTSSSSLATTSHHRTPPPHPPGIITIITTAVLPIRHHPLSSSSNSNISGVAIITTPSREATTSPISSITTSSNSKTVVMTTRARACLTSPPLRMPTARTGQRCSSSSINSTSRVTITPGSTIASAIMAEAAPEPEATVFTPLHSTATAIINISNIRVPITAGKAKDSSIKFLPPPHPLHTQTATPTTRVV